MGALNLLGRASTALHRLDQAEEFLRDSVRIAATIRHEGGLCQGLECLAAVLHATERDDQALLLLTVADRERRRSRMPVPAAEAGQLANLTRDIRSRLGERSESVAAGAAYLTVEDLLDQLALQR